MDYEAIRIQKNRETKFALHHGIQMIEIKERYARGEVEVKEYFENMVHSLHGGILFTLADATGGAATTSHGKVMTTINCDFHYLRAGMNVQKLTAIGKMIKEGKKIGVSEVEVYADKDTEREKLLAKGTFTYYFLDEDL